MLQGSPEWRQARAGKLTASRFHEAVARIQKGWGASRSKYMWDIIEERLSGVPKEQGFVSPAMRFGTENEPRARAAYEFYHAPVVEVGFIDHPTILNAGASPDGLVGEHGMIEIKVPDSDQHYRTLCGEPIKHEYMLQVFWQMACRPERQWVDFVSFNPRLPPDLEHKALKVIRVQRDQDIICGLEDEARQFLREIDQIIAELYDGNRRVA